MSTDRQSKLSNCHGLQSYSGVSTAKGTMQQLDINTNEDQNIPDCSPLDEVEGDALRMTWFGRFFSMVAFVYFNTRFATLSVTNSDARLRTSVVLERALPPVQQ